MSETATRWLLRLVALVIATGIWFVVALQINRCHRLDRGYGVLVSQLHVAFALEQHLAEGGGVHDRGVRVQPPGNAGAW